MQIDLLKNPEKSRGGSAQKTLDCKGILKIFEMVLPHFCQGAKGAFPGSREEPLAPPELLGAIVEEDELPDACAPAPAPQGLWAQCREARRNVEARLALLGVSSSDTPRLEFAPQVTFFRREKTI